MFERFSDDARAVIRRAAADAKGFGHRYVGTEHLLLALTASAGPAGEILRERGVRPELVTEQIIRQAGLGVGAGLFAGLDEQALASIGIDLDAVRARIEASFSPAALLGAERAIRQQRPAWYRRRRRVRPAVVDAAGRYVPEHLRHFPFTPQANRVLGRALREAVGPAGPDSVRVGVEQVALAVLGDDSGLVRPILAALHADAAPLRAAIRNRYRAAS